MNAYILLKSTRLGSFIACVVADEPAAALERLRMNMNTDGYRAIGFDDVLKDDWIITPPERLTTRDLIEVPEGKSIDLIIEASQHFM